MSTIARHGDISFHPAKLPTNAKEVEKTTKFIAAYGEATGHHHVIEGSEFQILESKGVRYYVFSKPAEISHPEHRTYTIPPGTYRQNQEVEEDPFSEEVRAVID